MYSLGFRPRLEPKSIGPGPGKFHLEHKSRYGEKYYQTYIGKRLNDLSKLIISINTFSTEIFYGLIANLNFRERLNARTSQVQVNGFNRCGTNKILQGNCTGLFNGSAVECEKFHCISRCQQVFVT